MKRLTTCTRDSQKILHLRHHSAKLSHVYQKRNNKRTVEYSESRCSAGNNGTKEDYPNANWHILHRSSRSELALVPTARMAQQNSDLRLGFGQLHIPGGGRAASDFNEPRVCTASLRIGNWRGRNVYEELDVSHISRVLMMSLNWTTHMHVRDGLINGRKSHFPMAHHRHTSAKNWTNFQ